jgi:hypothetical protein
MVDIAGTDYEMYMLRSKKENAQWAKKQAERVVAIAKQPLHFPSYCGRKGVRGGAVGRGTALQAARPNLSLA